ncbi:MAG: PAS domain S-box protein [Planctomycetaceae bacterium]|nr:PAS domain S-box protein [Planctomycetaceae bacterium]
MSDESNDRPPANNSTPSAVVGIGASAGGLEALERFFSTVADDSGLAYIILQHVDPAGSDALHESLRKFTCLPVVRIGESTRLEPNTAYVSPAHSSIACTNGEVKSVKLDDAKQRATSVDRFLQSLADAAERRAIGVILSGAGADGTLGLKAIADAGGMTLAQDADSAQYDSMPGNAAATGVVDHVLPPEKMPSEIVAYARHIDGLQEEHGPASWNAVESVLPNICNVLLKETEHDFKHYKSSTLVRRVLRRIQIRRIASAEQYLKLIQEDQDETQLLFRELLIGVTSFFRDPDTFSTLAEMVLPKLFENRALDEPVRVWVPGCATGEEAYTLAILLREATVEVDPAPDFQIFATDINERAVNRARHGVYPLSIAEHVTESRLKRFFVKRGGQYEVKRELRDRCTFSSHNLISDPPFSRLDLISCRNLLIYLGPHLQQKLIPVFHFSLRPGGYLLLGPSENLAEHTEVFRPVDKKHRISQRKEMAVKSGTLLPSQNKVRAVSTNDERAKAIGDDIQQISQRILLDEFAPRYVVVNEDAYILCTSGNLDKYLALPEGTFQNNAVKLARTGLRSALRSGLHQARSNKRKVTHDDLSVSYGEQVQRVQLVVQPMPSLGDDSSLFMIVFKDLSEPVSPNADAETSPTSDDSLAEQLERELNRTRDELENAVQELERSNEELKSSNEELLSMNEELQTANEELETSKEEIQSGMEALDRSKSDLENLLHGTQIGTIFLDAEGNINSFTPAAREIYNIRPSDVGRPLKELSHNVLAMPPLPKFSMLDNLEAFPADEVPATGGRWFLRRALPYRYDGKVDGTILTFVDITAHKLAANRLAVEHKVTRLLADTDSFESRVPEILDTLRQGVNAAICNLWLVDAEGDTLTCAETSLAEQGPGVRAFAEESRKTNFRISEGLPGHVWNTLKTHWVEDVTTDPFFLRREAAKQCGLTSGIALPIVVGKEFRGAIELYGTEPFGFQQSLLDMLTAVGSDIGQFIVSRQLHHQLRDEESRKSAILTAALDCVVTMDMAGRIVDFNAAAERTFGYSAADVQGLPLAEVIIPEQFREQHIKGFRRYLETGASQILGQRIELTARRRDGSEFPVEVSIHATFTRAGRPFFTGYLRDITARKQAEEVLNQRARLASLHASLAIELSGEAELEVILQRCCQHFVDQLDAAFARIWLYDEKESVLELTASAGVYTHLDGPHSRVALGDLKIGRIASQQKPLLTNDVFNDPNIGDPAWAKREGFVAFAGYPLVVENRVVGVVAMFARHELAATVFEQMVPMGDAIAQCIARKHSENRIYENEERLREQQSQLISVLAESEATKAKLQVLFDQSMYYAGVLDLNGVLTDINQTALVQCGYESDEVIGKPFWQTPWWSGSQEVQGKLREAVRRAAAGESYREELPYWLSDGTERCTDFALTPATNENGDVIFLVPTGADITDRKAAEVELLDREAHLRRVINNQLGLVGVIDRNGVLLEVDDQSLSIAGLTRDDVIGKHFAECGWWTYDPTVVQQMRESMKSAFAGERVRFDVPLYAAGNQRLMIDFMLAPVRDEHGTITHLIPSGVDISDRVEAERSRQETAVRLEAVVSTAVDGIITSDAFGTINSVNPAACELFGYSEDELVGNNVGMLMPEPYYSQHDSYFTDYRDTGEQKVIGKKRELAGRRKDGTVFPLDLAVSETFLEGDHCFVGIVRDVTERKQVEVALQQNAERLTMAMKAGGMAAWEWSPEGSVWTDELYDLLGIPNTRTACPETFFEVVHPEDLPELQAEWEKSMQGLKAYNQEFRIVRPDGEVRWIVGMGEVVYDKRGAVQRIFGLNWDSTEGHATAEALRASERRAQEASLSKSEFLANMSHEIRTPMTAVLGYTDLLASRESEPEKLDYLRTIKRNGNFLLDIINDILDLSKIEAGKMELMPEVFALQQVLADVRSMMDVRAKEKELDFRVEFDGLIPSKIESDPKRLKQILVNLTGNAIKFTQKGSVRLTVKYRGGEEPQMQFDIIDTGIGMTEEQQGKLFQPFSQGDASVTRAFGGTGLGLAISQRLAEMLGGRISAKSEFGVGSTFSVLISAGAVDENDLISPTLDSSSDAALPQLELHRLDCRVLVVDDRRDVRFLAKHFLNKAGADVIMAEDGEKAVQLVEQMNDGELAHVDLILLDMQMPRLDGYQTASKLRNMNYRKPIIALTADAMQGDMSRCLTSGCDAYLSKPIDATRLLDLVVEYLQIDENELQSRRVAQANRIATPSTLNEGDSDEDAANGRTIRVLIVDDSVDACNMLRLVLEAENFRAECAYDGATAIELAKEYHPSHVILDITLSDMSGYDVLQSLRSIPELANTTFMALTGHTGAEHIERSLAAGFDQHLAKPIEPVQLIKLLRSSVS